MKNEEKLLPFLKEYAKILKDGISWSDLGDVYLGDDSFPAGRVAVKSMDLRDKSKSYVKDSEVIATFHTKGMPCSMPVSARDFQLADLLIKSIKYLQKMEYEEKEGKNRKCIICEKPKQEWVEDRFVTFDYPVCEMCQACYVIMGLANHSPSHLQKIASHLLGDS